MMYWNNGMNGWGIGLMTVGMLLFWGLVAFGVVALVRYLGRSEQHRVAGPPPPSTPPPPTSSPERPTPERLFAERLARGEIDPDEYRSRLATLRGDGPPA
ncbi:SHOCT domain-containing protein [Kitasatospora sp. NPDC051170]|uniref:SHOCT domain-containing protein n=1 Tax=Kitasatospora sp. NPDC051170 TaxID=3364056 RepID=UPI00378EF4D6